MRSAFNQLHNRQHCRALPGLTGITTITLNLRRSDKHRAAPTRPRLLCRSRAQPSMHHCRRSPPLSPEPRRLELVLCPTVTVAVKPKRHCVFHLCRAHCRITAATSSFSQRRRRSLSLLL
jgi:hypothetical protein